MKVTVVGLGKIGLPLAVQYAGAGHQVTGVDIADPVVADVNDGRPPFPGEAELDERLAAVVAEDRLTATTSYANGIPGADVVVVVVPLFVHAEGAPDFASMDAATKEIGWHLTAGTTVIYETTLPVGTTRGRWKALLEKTSEMKLGEGFHLAFSPERVLTGRIFADLRKYPKLVGGVTPESARRAIDFYRSVLQFDPRPDLGRDNGVWDMGSAEAAELAKLAETTYRDVNIGLANQFARFADRYGIDIYQVIEASNSQPYSHIHRPGIAVGGHCIPVYPRLYLWNDSSASVVEAAREANLAMPSYAVGLLEGSFGSLTGVRVAVLGAAYRGGVKETAFSGVFPTVAALRSAGAIVQVHDPMYADYELRSLGFEPYELGDPVQAAVLQADHSEYRKLAPGDLPGIRAFVDGRACCDPALWSNEPDISYRVIGAP